jgi:serine-type D-Ala-D-Ala carboxypeptidase (penicillin-binding protein 5/6)
VPPVITPLPRPGVRRGLTSAAAFLVAVLCWTAGSLAPAQAAADPAPELQAAAWYLVGEDGAVLAERRADESRAIASITKLMTAVVTLEHAGLSDEVTVAPRSARIGESTANLRTGERLPVSTLLRALLVASANDAADALASHVGEGSTSRFAELMNAKADALGLEHTHFVNPHGLDQAGHVSSAEDATKLLRYALGVPFIRDAVDRSSVELPGGREFPTTDDLLDSWPPLLGGKTGHTADAGWSETAAARARGVTVYGTVLGGASRTGRNDALQELLSYGLGQYHRVAAIDASRTYAEVETGYDRPAVRLVAPRTLAITLRQGKPLVERIVVPGVTELPVRKGERLGKVEVYDGNRLVASSRLVAAQAVSEPGWLGKASWYAQQTAANLWGIFS